MNRKTDARDQLREMVSEWPEAQEEYERLEPRFAAISELIRARKREHLSQAELARRMGVSAAVLSRLESAAHSPRVDTLAEAARAMGQRLEVRFVRQRALPVVSPASDAGRSTVAAPKRVRSQRTGKTTAVDSRRA